MFCHWKTDELVVKYLKENLVLKADNAFFCVDNRLVLKVETTLFHPQSTSSLENGKNTYKSLSLKYWAFLLGNQFHGYFKFDLFSVVGQLTVSLIFFTRLILSLIHRNKYFFSRTAVGIIEQQVLAECFFPGHFTITFHTFFSLSKNKWRVIISFFSCSCFALQQALDEKRVFFSAFRQRIIWFVEVHFLLRCLEFHLYPGSTVARVDGPGCITTSTWGPSVLLRSSVQLWEPQRPPPPHRMCPRRCHLVSAQRLSPGSAWNTSQRALKMIKHFQLQRPNRVTECHLKLTAFWCKTSWIEGEIKG